MTEVAERLAAVRARIAAAAGRAGRDPAAIRLVAVSKLVAAAAIRAALAAGVTDLGENYAQELQAKQAELGAGPRWHFIGTLQRNKVKLVAGRVDLIHAVDSEPLALEIARRAHAAGAVQRVLVAVSLAGEAQKSGVTAAALGPLLDRITGLPGLAVAGLMTMPPLSADGEATRPYFRRLRELAASHRRPGRELAELSMGTTADFEPAVEEGATLVRVGTAIFGPRQA